MSNDQEKFWDQFEPFLDGNLTNEETLAFENWLKNNEDAQITLKGYQIGRKSIPGKSSFDSANESLQNRMIKMIEEKRLKSTYTKVMIVSIAASISLLFFVITIYVLVQKNNDLFSEMLSEYSSEIYPASLSVRGIAKHEDEWITLYEQQKFSEVITYLENHGASKEEEFYLALSYFYSGLFNESEVLLYKLEKENFIYREHARWYLILNNLNQGKFAPSKELLSYVLLQRTHYKKKEAVTLNSVLKKQSSKQP